MTTEQNFWENYGGPWRFNQAAGWLRLLTRGPEICGELWLSAAKRFSRRGHRRFRLLGKEFEIHFWSEQSPAEIVSGLREQIEKLARELHRGRLVLDLECFDTMATHVDWRRLLGLELRPDMPAVLTTTTANQGSEAAGDRAGRGPAAHRP